MTYPTSSLEPYLPSPHTPSLHLQSTSDKWASADAFAQLIHFFLPKICSMSFKASSNTTSAKIRALVLPAEV